MEPVKPEIFTVYTLSKTFSVSALSEPWYRLLLEFYILMDHECVVSKITCLWRKKKIVAHRSFYYEIELWYSTQMNYFGKMIIII